MGSSNCAMKKINGSVSCVNPGGGNTGGGGLCGSNGGGSSSESGNGNGSDIGIQSSIGGCVADSSVLCYPSPYEMTKLTNGGNSSTLAPGSHLTSHHLTGHHMIHSSNGGVDGSCGDVNTLAGSNGNLVDHLNNTGVHTSPLKGTSLLECASNGEPMYATVKRTPRVARNNTSGGNVNDCHVYQYPLTLTSLLQNNHHSLGNTSSSVAGSESCFGDTESCISLASTTNGTVGAPTSTAFFRISEESSEKGLTAGKLLSPLTYFITCKSAPCVCMSMLFYFLPLSYLCFIPMCLCVCVCVCLCDLYNHCFESYFLPPSSLFHCQVVPQAK